jgi:uncharacterized membrane protein YfcA
MIEILLLIALGGITGFFSGLLGLGGGLLLVPGMLFIIQDAPHEQLMHFIIGASLMTTAFTATINTISHHRKGKVIWQYFFKFAPFAAFGVIIGVIIAQYVSTTFLKTAFGIYEIIVAIIMFFGISASGGIHNVGRWVWRVLGIATGVISSLLGINGGTITNPFLVYNNINIKNAMATATAIGVPISIIGSVGFLIINNGSLPLIKLIAIIIPSILVAPFGVWVLHQTNGAIIKKIFAFVVATLGVIVLVN